MEDKIKKYSKINKICIIAIIISVIIGYVTPNEGIGSIIANYCYVHIMFIFLIIEKAHRTAFFYERRIGFNST